MIKYPKQNIYYNIYDNETDFQVSIFLIMFIKT